MAEITQEIVTFCAEEVERQGRGPIQVAWMVEAWQEAMDYGIGPPLESATQLDREAFQGLLQLIGHLIEHQNPDQRWRQVNVRVGRHICPDVREVPDLMDKWTANLQTMTSEEAYKELLLIHPLADGNGRLGKIAYNMLRGTLDKPQMPPNFFNCANP